MNKEQQELLDEAYIKYLTESWKPQPLDVNEFESVIKQSKEFSEKWGLKIEERELSLEERSELGYKYVEYNKWDALLGGGKESDEELCDDYNIPTKLITITYNDKTIESYE
jgi:hypothetical protein